MRSLRQVRISLSASLRADRVAVPSVMRDIVPCGGTIVLRTGGYAWRAGVESHPEDDLVVIPSDVGRALGFHDGMVTNLRAAGDTLLFGPVIGTFISIGHLESIQKGAPDFRLTELAKANLSIGTLLYFFSISGIDLENRRITGYHYRHTEGAWVRQPFPFPDVLYDRAGGFPPCLETAVRRFRRLLGPLGIAVLNAQNHFDKWETYAALRQYREVRPYLLETVLCRTAGDIEAMLNKYGTVYLKQVDGSNGRQVMKLTRDQTFKIGYFRDRVINLSFDSWPAAVLHIDLFFGGRPFIVQRGVGVPTLDGGPVDIRVLAQKDETAHWRITARPVRIGRPSCAVTSTQSGSRVYDLPEAFARLGLSPGTTDRLRERIDELASCVAAGIERAFGSFGEIGIDVAVDTDLNPFFIECNAKPGKDTVVLLNRPEVTGEAFGRPLRYAMHLAGFVAPKTAGHNSPAGP